MDIRRAVSALLVLAIVGAGFAAPTIDGKISAGEWVDAAIYDGLKMRGKKEAFPAKATTYVTVDTNALYIAMRSAAPKDGFLRRVMPGRGDSLARIDDCVLILLSEGRRLAVNANGAVTVKGEKPEGFVCASTVTNGWWDFECSLPLASAGDLRVVNIGRHWALADDKYGADTSLGVKDVVPAADAPRFQVLGVEGDDKAYVVKMRVMNPTRRSASVDVRVESAPENSQPAVMKKNVSVPAGETRELELKGAILNDELVSLSVAAKTSDKKLRFARKLKVRPNFAGSPFVKVGDDNELVAYKFAYYPSYNQFRARVDVSLVPDWKRLVKGVRCLIIDAAGKEVSSHLVTKIDAKGIADETFAVPDLRPLTVASGNPEYRARFVIEGLNAVTYEKRLYRHAMDWEGNSYGLSEIVVPPFEKMQVDEAKQEVRTVLRRHKLNGLGLFEQVWCPANEGLFEPTVPILADGGVNLVATVGGKDVVLRGQLEIPPSSSPVKRSLKATFDQDGLKGFVEGEFEYDGQLAWRLTLEQGRLDWLKLVIPMKADQATHMHATVDGLRHNFGGHVPAGQGMVWNGSLAKGRRGILGDYLPYMWIGGPLRGLSVYGENDRGWIHFDGWPTATETSAHCQEVRRAEDGTVSLVLNLVQKPIAIEEPVRIRLAFMATPVKPMLKDWRLIDYGWFLGSGSQWGAGPQDADVCPFDGTDEFWVKMSETRDKGKYDEDYLTNAIDRCFAPGKPGDFEYGKVKSHNAVHFRSGMENAKRCGRDAQMVWYTNARGVDFGIPSGTTFCDQWSRWEFMDMDRDFTRMSKRDYDLDPDRAFQDYAGWWYRKMVLSGACDSLYWDDIYLQSNFDLVGTDAYRIDDGRIQPATGVNNMRALVKRCATVQAECGKNATNNWIHMTDTAIAPISAFAGVHYDMEDSPRNGDAFQQKYPMDYLEAVSIGRQMGARVKVIAHYEKISEEKNDWYERTGAGMMLCYEFGWKYNAKVLNAVMAKLKAWGYRTNPVVRVWNYWNRDEAYPLALNREQVASIALAKPSDHEAIVIVNDFSGKGGEVKIKVDAQMLGLKRGFKAFDFEQEGEVPLALANDEISVVLKPYDFAVVILK